MGIEVKINGNVILNVVALSIRSSLAVISNSFSILLSPGKNATQKESNLNFKAGETASIEIDGISVINGFVDAVRVTYSNAEHKIELAGRDRTADFIDSSTPEINIEGAIQFEELLRTTLDQMELQSIGITNLIPASSDLLIRETKNIESEIGQTGFEFIDQFARLKQVLLKGDGAGNIQMTRGGGDQLIKAPLINIPNIGKNNIISGIFTQSHTNRFNTYIVKSQEDFSSSNFDFSVDEAVDNSGGVIDPNIRKGRNIVFEAEENSTSEECSDRAAWEANLRRSRETNLIIQVVGYSVLEKFLDKPLTVLWEPNAKVIVVDVFSNIQSAMLIESVNYELSEATGRTTKMTLVPPDSYAILAAKDAVEARIAILGKEDDF